MIQEQIELPKSCTVVCGALGRGDATVCAAFHGRDGAAGAGVEVVRVGRPDAVAAAVVPHHGVAAGRLRDLPTSAGDQEGSVTG